MEQIEIKNKKKSIWFKVGILLLIVNFPIGYGGIAITGMMTARTGKSSWLIAGGGFYALSWIMLFAGTLLTGAEGIKTIKKFLGRMMGKP